MAHDVALSVYEEASADAEARLAKEDAGWQEMGKTSGNIMTDSDRNMTVCKARVISVKEGIGKQLVSLWRNYAVGSGIEWSARSEQATNVINAYWLKPDNKVVNSFHGQRTTEDKKLVDGDLFTAFFFVNGDMASVPTVRWLDALQMTVATDPDDKWTPRWHIRTFMGSNGKTKTVIYRDWKNTDGKPGVVGKDIIEKGDARIDEGAVVYHTQLTGSPDNRGYSLLTPVVQWIDAYRNFMRSRVSIQQALSVVAQKLKIQGGQTAVNAQVAQHRSSLTTSGSGGETNPVAARGALFVENQSAKLENMKQETGAAAAKVDGEMLIQMAGLGAGVFPHYIGQGDSAILATATMMEGPMLRQFDAERLEVHDYYRNIFEWLLDLAGVPEGDDRKIDISSMPVNIATTDSDVAAIAALTTVWPELKGSDELRKRALSIMNMENVEEILAALEDFAGERGEDDAPEASRL
jgi:hypothetical protein